MNALLEEQTIYKDEMLKLSQTYTYTLLKKRKEKSVWY